MLIRTMTIEDYEEVYALWLSCKGMGLNTIDDSREGIERLLKRNPATCFVAIDGDKIIGAVLATNDGRRGYFQHLAVREEYRHQGTGSALVSAAMEALKQEQITKVCFVVFKTNEAGNAFWQAHGFTVRSDLNYRDRQIVDFERIDT